MLRLLPLLLGVLTVAVASDLPTRKYLNLAAIKTMAAAADQLKGGDLSVLAFPDAFPNQGGVPILLDGQTIGAIACSGAASEVDEAISQAAVDALLKK